MADDQVMTGSRWIGPFQLRDYLERCIDPTQEWPPEAAGAYLISRRTWAGEPTAECDVLYVGSNPNAPTQFRNRIGLLVKDMLGLGRHRVGQSQWRIVHLELVLREKSSSPRPVRKLGCRHRVRSMQ